MTQGIITPGQPERWLSTLVDGEVLQQQWIQPDCIVIRVADLPALFFDSSVIPDCIAQEVEGVINQRWMVA